MKALTRNQPAPKNSSTNQSRCAGKPETAPGNRKLRSESERAAAVRSARRGNKVFPLARENCCPKPDSSAPQPRFPPRGVAKTAWNQVKKTRKLRWLEHSGLPRRIGVLF